MLIWIAFVGLILLLLALDLGVFHRSAHVVRTKEALLWSAFWVTLGLLFSVFVYFGYENQWLGLGRNIDAISGTVNDGTSAAINYLTGYVVEKSLSIDNIFVIAMLFGAFGVPAIYQHRVLFWGIVGALVLRGVMIMVGAELIMSYHWVLYVFGALLVLTAAKMLILGHGSRRDPLQHPVVRLIKRIVPVTDEHHAQHFLARVNGRWTLTPLALALTLVESTDLVFAVDSIPAVFAITADPFLVFTSNVFAILGLRSLYFALAGMMEKFEYLKISLVAILALVGVKMLAKDILHAIPGVSFYTLGMIALILTAGVAASLVRARRLGQPVGAA
jgi:tellurite resistance protein TerC